MTGVPSHNKIATEEEEHSLGTNEILILRTKRKQFLDLFFAVSILLNIHLKYYFLFTFTHRQKPFAETSYETGFDSDLGMYK